MLIGFMGAGKTAVGRELKSKTGWPLFDTDEMVAARFAMPITRIFAQFGEEDFRSRETEILRELSGAEPGIIVTGGGIILQRRNVQLMRALGTVVNLEADEETLMKRVSGRISRPLLQTDNPRATLHEMLRRRQPLYFQAADLNIDTSELTHQQVASAVLKNLGLS